jgi:phosphopantothenoylcysteine decarboxylase
MQSKIESRNILLGLTGSVATMVADKVIRQLQNIGNVRVVVTEKAEHFLPWMNTDQPVPVYYEADEWQWRKKGDTVEHIDLKDWASALVIAPLSANTLAKMANGICDNLLTSIVRAWGPYKPLIIAPSMNTAMWEHPASRLHIGQLIQWFECEHVPPVIKDLACGETGEGAMAHASSIADATHKRLKWQFPLAMSPYRGSVPCPGIPVGNHPGSFGAKRKHGTHAGVDLYTDKLEVVRPVEPGIVRGVYPFTGPSAGKPWWNDTMAVAVEGASGIVVYGELRRNDAIVPRVGDRVTKLHHLGCVGQVLKDEKPRDDVPGHSLSMLHLNLLDRSATLDRSGGPGTYEDSWPLGAPQPEKVLDPTPYLLEVFGPKLDELGVIE